MRLNKLELNGFKSFARKTEIVFDDGITAVIGPNGSGKSNIADAIRWVLGEQSAKVLRGSKMEDVIFNGTQERKAQSYCEVTLTFDNSDGRLPLEFNEVSVMRRVYRSGESEYAINRNNCRLKDINELFRDTGIGKEGYSIIGQGKVEEILSNKSGDRRAAFEEAAGVMRYRVRKEEAERKLEHTQKNLVRLEDILGELALQLEPLAAQSESARQFLTLRDELKDLELNVFLYQYDRFTERIKAASAAITEIEDEENKLSKTEEAVSENLNTEEERARSLEQAVTSLQNDLLSMMREAETHQGEAKVLRERYEHLTRERERLLDTLKSQQEACAAHKAALEQLSSGGEGKKAEQETLNAALAATKNELAACDEKITAQEALLEQQKNSIMEALNRLSDAKSQASRLEAMAASLNTRLDAIAAEEEKIEEERVALVHERADAVDEGSELKQSHDELIEKQNEYQAELQHTQEQNNEAQQRLYQLEQEQNSLRSRCNVLEEMARDYEGYYASVRNLFRDANHDIHLKRAVLGVVAELVIVPQKYELALEMSLGAALQNIVTPTPEDGKRIIDHLRSHNYGRATLLPVSAMKPRLLTREERGFLAQKGVLGVASELVSFDRQYQNVVDNLLGRTVIVENMDVGIALNRKAGAAFRIATLAGDIIHPGGSMTGGSTQKREFSLLGRERELAELKERIAANERGLQESKKQREQAATRAAAAQEALKDVEAKLHQQDIVYTRYTEKLDMIDRDIQRNQQKRQQCDDERSQIADTMEDIRQQQGDAESVTSGIEQGSAASQEDVQKSQELLYTMRQEREAINARHTEQMVQAMALQKEEDASRAEERRLQKELEAAIRAAESCEAAIADNTRQTEALLATEGEMGSSISVEQEKLSALQEQCRQMEEEKNLHAASFKEMRDRKDEITGRLRVLSEMKHKQELAKSRSDMELENIQTRIWDDYELTYDNVLPLRHDIGITAAHLRIDELKAAMRELGDVNVNAIEDYKSVSERHTTLQEQCDDLNRAKEDLNVLIEELKATMQELFLSQFALIQENFTQVFRELFGGGFAELRLSDKNDVLNCDIDIIAQPPGKKLSLLSLLSGGERALTAIALLFAMLKLKPTAFCVLDEIESSLDEVNVSRFARYLKDYAEDTQFIIITHRKGSMEVCNALYGVAMEEKGVSKVVSAQFSSNGAVNGETA